MSAPDFFVSYTHADSAWAEWIAWQLEAHGYRVIVQAWDFPAGANFIVEMNRAAQGSTRTIAVLSAEYLASQFSTAEWTAALAQDPSGQRGTLIPVRTSGPPPSGLLASMVWVDLVGRDETEAKNMLLAAASLARAKPDRAPSFPGDRLKPRFPLELPRIWNIPARNEHFTGRSELLTRLVPELTPGVSVVVTQAIAGLGGIGKTQLAIEYAHRNASRYRVAWWVRAEKAETRLADLQALAQQLSLPGLETMPAEMQVGALRAWLEQNLDWLLIFDNVERRDLLEEIAPRAGGGHILVTSRISAWGTSARVMSLDLWAPAEASSYLLRRTGQTDEEVALVLAETLGYLPLAIEQAAAYVDESKITIEKYIELFRRSRSQLLTASRGGVTVATIWSLSLEAVKSESQEAVALLHLLAFLPPDSVPREQLHGSGLTLDPMLARVLESELVLNDAIAVLRRYSLIGATPTTLSVHRLVQAVVQGALTDRDHRLFSETAYYLQHGGVDAVQTTTPLPVRSERAFQKRWLLRIIAGVIAAGVITAWGVVTYSRMTLRSELATIGGLILQNSAAALDFNDSRLAHETIDTLRSNNRVVAACLYTLRDQRLELWVRNESQDIACPAAPDGALRGAGWLTVAVLTRSVPPDREAAILLVGRAQPTAPW